MLEFRNVTFQYDVEDFNIIDDLSFHIGKGEFVSVIGPSGCGKSTIFRLTGQLLTRKSGDILVGGESIDGRRGYCGYMPQRDLLFPWRTVNENLRLPMEVRGGIPRAEIDPPCGRDAGACRPCRLGVTSVRRSFRAECGSGRPLRAHC